MNNLDFLGHPNMALVKYRHHHRILYGFMVMNLVFEVLLYTYMIRHRDFIIATLADAYREVPIERITGIFYGGTTLDVLVNSAMYYCGYKAMRSHQVTSYNQFVWLLLASIFTRIVISYLNM